MRNLGIFFALLALVGCQPSEEPAAAAAEPASAPAAAPEAASLDVVDVESDVSKVEFENDLVRVIRTRRPAGHEGARHTHGKGVFVASQTQRTG